MSKKQHWLYVIARLDEDIPVAPVKVGITNNLTARLASVQTGSPNRLCIVHAFAAPNREVARALEGGFHEHMGEKRLAGEWFDVEPMHAVAVICVAIAQFLEEMGIAEADRGAFLDLFGVVHAAERLAGAAEYIRDRQGSKLQ